MRVWKTSAMKRNTDLAFLSRICRELAKYEFLPQLLALKNSLIEPLTHPEDLTRIVEIKKILKNINEIVNASDTYLMDPRGLTLAASNWDSERPFVGNYFAYRPYFKEAMKGRLGRYYALGSTSNKRGYYFAYPIRREDEILGVVVMKISISPIETAWQDGPDEFIVTDPYGVIFVTTQPDWKFKSLRPLSAETLRQIEVSQRYGHADIATLSIISDQASGNNTQIVTIRNPAFSPQGTNSPAGAKQDYLVQDTELAEAGWKIHVLSNLEPVQAQITGQCC